MFERGELRAEVGGADKAKLCCDYSEPASGLVAALCHVRLSNLPPIRKVIYTTNTIESLNYSTRKVLNKRSAFPNDEAMQCLGLFLPNEIYGARDHVSEFASCHVVVK